MKPETIQTLHPDKDKTNKKIALEKYLVIRNVILEILNESEPTQMELMEAIHERIKGNFDGNAQWYGETVKLDLEARELIKRTKSKPVRYLKEHKSP
ncbi:hypothetical protein [Lacihabitans sp. LS3-19]|uniref:DUF6958 family protein n=1 Tax=Lacihabitans sp. LS3-19 TaxID=2487335 RepID=UPI0020CB9A89|nr:hypothetical protein [Lacihabitans sp. LS3-19]